MNWIQEDSELLNKTLKKNKHEIILPIFLTILFVMVLVWMLMLDPVVGISDSNGLYSSQVYTNNLYFLEVNEEVQFSGYFVNDYGVSQYYNEYPNQNTTSANMFIGLAKLLNRMFSNNKEVFDIRFLSGIYIAYAAIAIILFYNYISKSNKKIIAIIMTIIIGLIICDTEFSLYFNSFNTLPVIVLSAVNAFIWLLFLIDTDLNKIAASVGFMINIVILIFCENVYGMVGIVLAVMLLVMYLIERKNDYYNIFLTLTVSVFVLSILSIAITSNVVTHVDKYHSITRGVLKTTENPEEIFYDYDESPNYSVLSGNLYYEDFAIVEPENKAVVGMYDDVSTYDISKYYFGHPSAFASLLRESFANVYSLILENTGSYRYQDNETPNVEFEKFSLISKAKEYAAPKTIGAILVLFGIIITFTLRKPKILTLLLFLISASVLPIVVGIIRSGNLNINSYSPLYNIVFDFVCLIIASIMFEHVAEYFERVKDDAK